VTVMRFKFRGKIIKEMPGSVASVTPYISSIGPIELM